MEIDIPSNAPKTCPGTSDINAGKASGCDGCPNQKLCASGNSGKMDELIVSQIKARLSKVKNIILIMSGKGGVGKSSITASLAWKLSSLPLDKMVGILDVDITGPSIPTMMACEEETVHKSMSGWSPIFINDNLEVMSVGMLLEDPDQAIIWRGPRKNKIIENMLSDVDWSELDYLIIDTPPGTTDEHISLVNYLRAAGVTNKTRSVIVTTGQEVALSDVRKQIEFCGKVNLKIVGIVGNMHDYKCSQCGYQFEVFPCTGDGVEGLCLEYKIPLLAQLPLDSRLTRSLDLGIPILTLDEDDVMDDDTADALEMLVAGFLKELSIKE